MIRDYWIEEIANIKEFQIIGEIEDSEFDGLKESFAGLIKNQFIETASKEGLERWEKLLNIQPFENDTEEGRRFRIFAKWNLKRPYSVRALSEKLEDLVGADGFTMEVDKGNYIVKVFINLGQKRMLDSAAALVREIVPANMITDVKLRFNRYGDYLQYTYEDIKSISYEDIKAEVININR